MGCVGSHRMIIHFPHHGDVRLHEQIAEGGFSIVFRGKDVRDDHLHYAIKRVFCQEEDQLESAKHEIDIYDLFKDGENPHILKLLDSFISPSSIHPEAKDVYLLFHYYPQTLHDLINDLRVSGEVLEEKEALRLFIQICEAVLKFHSLDPPLAVRDIKAANVLLTDVRDCLLMDFGSVVPARVKIEDKRQAIHIQEEAEKNATASCRAIELFDVQVGMELDERTDVWSLGTLLYFLCFQNHAFDSTQGSIRLAAMNGIRSFPNVGNYSQDLRDFILEMVCLIPTDRPFVPQVLQKASILLDKLQNKL